jgi:inhibitor of KinA sporulation pathway (predicted exonuclease)
MPHAVVFDLEFTAWPGSMEHRWLRPGEFREVVQIGAIKLDAASFAEDMSLDLLVKPRFNPVLSPYFEGLTGITNMALENRGMDFAEAYAAFVAFADGAPIFAFGRDDLVLAFNLELYGLRNAKALPLYTNIIPWAREQGIDPRGFHAYDMARLAGVVFEGRAHNALDDARSVAVAIKTLVARGARNLLLAENGP